MENGKKNVNDIGNNDNNIKNKNKKDNEIIDRDLEAKIIEKSLFSRAFPIMAMDGNIKNGSKPINIKLVLVGLVYYNNIYYLVSI